jgi:peptide/nickel transport system ATP-binding protein
MTPLLEFRNVDKRYAAGRSGPFGFGKSRTVQALSGVNLSLYGGEVLGLAGESGSGKSTLGRIAVGLEQPTSGTILFDGRSLGTAAGRAERARLLALQMIFQNAVASLNPRLRAAETIAEPIRVHRGLAKAGQAVEQLAQQVGIGSDLLARFPHQMSGGQCQRVGIARALSVQPRLLVCDEPVSALDVSIQAQILNLFADLKEQSAFSCLFISHDIHVIERVSDRIAIMYLGRIVEIGPTREVLDAPNHPYTRALLEAVPRISRTRRLHKPIRGEIPSPLAPPNGCRFHPRCPMAMPVCSRSDPALTRVGERHASACHLNSSTAGLDGSARLEEV